MPVTADTFTLTDPATDTFFVIGYNGTATEMIRMTKAAWQAWIESLAADALVLAGAEGDIVVLDADGKPVTSSKKIKIGADTYAASDNYLATTQFITTNYLRRLAAGNADEICKLDTSGDVQATGKKLGGINWQSDTDAVLAALLPNADQVRLGFVRKISLAAENYFPQIDSEGDLGNSDYYGDGGSDYDAITDKDAALVPIDPTLTIVQDKLDALYKPLYPVSGALYNRYSNYNSGAASLAASTKYVLPLAATYTSVAGDYIAYDFDLKVTLLSAKLDTSQGARIHLNGKADGDPTDALTKLVSITSSFGGRFKLVSYTKSTITYIGLQFETSSTESDIHLIVDGTCRQDNDSGAGGAGVLPYYASGTPLDTDVNSSIAGYTPSAEERVFGKNDIIYMRSINNEDTAGDGRMYHDATGWHFETFDGTNWG